MRHERGKSPAASGTGTDETILAAAARVFTRLGYTRTTIADIAAEAGSTRPTVYSYFSSKEDIFRHLAEQVSETFSSGQVMPTELAPDQIIRTADTRYLRNYVDNIGLLTIIQHQSLAESTMSSLWEDMHSRINGAHIRFMERLRQRGVAKPVAPLNSIANAVNGIVMRYAQLLSDSESDFEQLADDLVQIHLSLLGMNESCDQPRIWPRH
ncbi:TetR/AcrR family transcriptional regulator [Brevibacterium daeguense]|uniref:TetR/AcrR family transcriptional regulator n=1 Tax=Brevibacterium daeguense TaxID=909936 RepID=A0ABP8EFI3_9MICO|nr:TetR/AcrR family transcriptional regulator [Brevibacterium daeguense]